MRFVPNLQCELGVENQKKILETQTTLNPVSHVWPFNIILDIIRSRKAFTYRINDVHD